MGRFPTPSCEDDPSQLQPTFYYTQHNYITERQRDHPGRDPVSNLVYSFTSRNAHTVLIDGQIVMTDRELLTVDESKLQRSFTDASVTWRERAGINLPERWP